MEGVLCYRNAKLNQNGPISLSEENRRTINILWWFSYNISFSPVSNLLENTDMHMGNC